MSADTPILNREQGEHLPGLGSRVSEPTGVLRKNLKMQVYLGIAVLFIVATAVSSFRHKPVPRQQGPAVPLVQDANANIEEMRRSLEQQQRQTAAIRLPNEPASGPPQPPTTDPYAANTTAATNCIPGQPCPNPPGYSPYQQQLSPERQEQLQLEQQERELAYKARFASNLAYSQSHGIGSQSTLMLTSQRQNKDWASQAANQTTARQVLLRRPICRKAAPSAHGQPPTIPHDLKRQSQLLKDQRTRAHQNVLRRQT